MIVIAFIMEMYNHSGGAMMRWKVNDGEETVVVPDTYHMLIKLEWEFLKCFF